MKHSLRAVQYCGLTNERNTAKIYAGVKERYVCLKRRHDAVAERSPSVLTVVNRFRVCAYACGAMISYASGGASLLGIRFEQMSFSSRQCRNCTSRKDCRRKKKAFRVASANAKNLAR